MFIQIVTLLQKKRLHSSKSESTVADILMTLAGFESSIISGSADNNANGDSPSSFSAVLGLQRAEDSAEYITAMLIDKLKNDDGLSPTMENLKTQVTTLMGDDERLDDYELLTKDKSTCSSTELEMIRRERNRMHAKKTRLRKKKMIQEMEAVRRFLPSVSRFADLV